MRRDEIDALVESIGEIGQRVYELGSQRRTRPTISFDGRPQLRILSLDPFQYQKLRKWTSPILHGDFGLVTVVPFTVNGTESVHAKVAFEAGNEIYAHAVGVDVLNSIAQVVGVEARFTPL